MRPRQLVYAEEETRQSAERAFPGSHDEFLATLDMSVTVARASLNDLPRVTELVTRPNQLGAIYPQLELEALLLSPSHECWLISLRDRFGDCGQVGLVLLATSEDGWTLELLLFSCRVIPRGIDKLVLNTLLRRARRARVRLRAHFRSTSRNESLWAAYLQAGFEPVTSEGDWHLLEHPLTNVPQRDPHIRLNGAWSDGA